MEKEKVKNKTKKKKKKKKDQIHFKPSAKNQHSLMVHNKMPKDLKKSNITKKKQKKEDLDDLLLSACINVKLENNLKEKILYNILIISIKQKIFKNDLYRYFLHKINSMTIYNSNSFPHLFQKL